MEKIRLKKGGDRTGGRKWVDVQEMHNAGDKTRSLDGGGGARQTNSEGCIGKERKYTGGRMEVKGALSRKYKMVWDYLQNARNKVDPREGRQECKKGMRKG